MISVIDCGLGNVGSIINMLKRLRVEAQCVSTPEQVAKSDKLILPGVGAFDYGMSRLQELSLVGVLNEAVLERRVPILGICLGLQMFTRGSEEGKRPGLGWIAGDTVRFRFPQSEPQLKVPHMGWNSIEIPQPDSLLQNLPVEPRFYFVHSYHLVCDDSKSVMTWTNYGYRFASGVRFKNIWGTQFHPEKSHKFGMVLLSNFGALS